MYAGYRWFAREDYASITVDSRSSGSDDSNSVVSPDGA